MFARLWQFFFPSWVRLSPDEQVIGREEYRSLKNDSRSFQRLLARLEELQRDYYLPLDLSDYKPLEPIDQVDIPDYLPEDI